MTEIENQVMAMRNTPMQDNDWAELIELPGVTSVAADVGSLALVPQMGEVALYWQFTSLDSMRQHFQPMFDELRPEIKESGVDFISMDMVQVRDRDWIQPLLDDAHFEFFAEWLGMTHPSLEPEAVPEIPDHMQLRQAVDDDVEKMFEIWTDGYGDLVQGPGTFNHYLDSSSWIGILEDDGVIVGFAINGPVEAGTGIIFDVVIASDHWNNGYGRLMLDAAAYQLTTQDARRAVIRVRPDIKQALRVCSNAGFRAGIGGIEYRRSTDEEAIVQMKAERRKSGVKARFGGWR